MQILGRMNSGNHPAFSILKEEFMKFFKSATILLIGLSLAAITLSSCATSVPVIVDHPPRIAMGTIRTVAVQDFIGMTPRQVNQGIDGIKPVFNIFEGGRNASAIVTDEFRNLIKTSRKLGLFDFSPGRYTPGGTPDAIISGEITDFSITTTVSTETRTEASGLQYKVFVTKKEVTLGFVYTVTEYSTGRLIDKIFKRGSDSRREEKRDPVPVNIDEYGMIKNIMSRIMPEVQKELMPWSETVSLSLEQNDKNPRFKQADELVKNRQYDAAVKVYMDEFTARQDPAAGYNAAVLIYAMGDRARAMSMMKDIAERFGYAKARSSYEWMRKTEEDEKKLRQM